MALSLSAAMVTALGANFSQPGLFVQLGFTSPLYLCDRASGATRSWNALTWTVADVGVSGYSLEQGIVQKITLEFVDSDYALTSLLLSQTSSDKNVKLWYFDSAATATIDPVLIVDGLIDDASGGDDRQLRVPCSSINRQLPVGMLAQLIPAYLFAPEGHKIFWGPSGDSIEFNRRESR